MPYIRKYERERIDPAISALVEALGTLNEGLVLVLRTAGVVHTSNLGGG